MGALDIRTEPSNERSTQSTLSVEDQHGGASLVPNAAFDPIESAMRQHPSLTRKKAEEMAEAFGF